MSQIEFITYGSVPGLGGYAPGTLARVSEDVARQLVERVQCARYVQPPAERAEPNAAPKRAKRSKPAVAAAQQEIDP